MKRIMFVTAVAIVSIFGNCARGDVCEIVNGSFEDDGRIQNIIAQEPNGWDVNVPAVFGGYVDREWPTDANFNLTLYSEYSASFDANDMATVSQDVCLTEIDVVSFDLKLDTYYGDPWDPNLCTAVLVIDNNVVWESSSVGSDVRGEYRAQAYYVDDAYKDGGLHKLALGLRVNVSQRLREYYMTQWDFVRFQTGCEGLGYLSGDINNDCHVNAKDLKMLAAQWLVDNPGSEYDLFEDDEGIVNFLDFAILAENWLRSSYEQGQ